jgi:hypothetical protein
VGAIRNASPGSEIDDDIFTDDESVDEETANVNETESSEFNLAAAAAAWQANADRRCNEHDYEKKPATLEPLPPNNVEAYPQENNAYFATKKYVRKDKYELAIFVNEDRWEFPSVMKAFN